MDPLTYYKQLREPHEIVRLEKLSVVEEADIPLSCAKCERNVLIDEVREHVIRARLNYHAYHQSRVRVKSGGLTVSGELNKSGNFFYLRIEERPDLYHCEQFSIEEVVAADIEPRVVHGTTVNALTITLWGW